MRPRLALTLFCACAPLACAELPFVETPGRRPGPRWGHVLVHDPLRERLLLFGGAPGSGQLLGDTWTFDGQRWKHHLVDGPPPRAFAAAAFHPGRGTIVLHGGRAADRRARADTWEWDGSAWREIGSNRPYAADHHVLVHLPESDELLAFGGWNGEDVTGETWAFDGSWRRVASGGPPARAAFGLAHDAARGTVCLYGGLWIDGQYADVWEWQDGAWRAASGPYANSSLDHHALVFDPVRGRVTGFGGKDYRYETRSRTFEVVGGRIRTLATEGPSPRHSTPLAWDGERVLLFGGKEIAGGELLPLGDLWAWDGERWKRLDG